MAVLKQFNFSAGVVVLLLLLLGLQATPVFSLKVNTTLKDCSRQCESENCLDPFDLRYGKYCGIGYTGCDGEPVCDGIDQCCLTHDNCIGSNLQNYVNRTCNDQLKDCVKQFRDANLPQFAGSNCSASEVENVIILSMTSATLGNPGSPSPPINLHWIEALVFMLSVVLCFGW